MEIEVFDEESAKPAPPPSIVRAAEPSSQSSEASPASLPEAEGVLAIQHVLRGLHSIGAHPVSLQLVYLAVNVSSLGLKDISLLANYSNLVIVDISNNLIDSLEILSRIPYLTTLNASQNLLERCLDFAPPLCHAESAWSQGQYAIGSMLTYADLSKNNIATIGDIHQHEFLECLLLKDNAIESTFGLQNLRYLLVLDLTNNRLTSLDSLDGLRLQELYISGNRLVSLEGLSRLSSLRILHADSNLIETTAPLVHIPTLREISVSRNRVPKICDLQHLHGLQHLVSVNFDGNPCSSKPFYRY